MGRAIWMGALGLVVGVAAMQAVETHRYASAMPVAQPVVRNVPLTPVADAPAQVREGTPNFRAAHFSQGPDRRSDSGIWACDGPTTFEWHFGSDEVVHVLEGQVNVTYNGQQFTLKPGDTAVFYQGSRAVWHVPQKVVKSYTLYHPGLLTRWLRKLTA